ncbi:MAG: DnaJ domain-containing protein [Myxococcota bacterium]
MSTPRPTATGSLESTPLLNLLIYALDNRLNGTLVLEEPGSAQKHAIQFVDGTPSKVKTATLVRSLGHVLVDLGTITEETRSRTFNEAAAAGELHGQVLLREGHIDEAGLRAGLREQQALQIVYLAGRPAHTLYGYYEGADLLERWGGPAVRGRPLNVIWRVVEAHAEPQRIAEVVRRLSDRMIQLHNDAPIQRFHFGRAEKPLIELLRAKPQPLTELIGRDVAERSLVERLVYALTITRQIELGTHVLPLGVDEPPSSIRPVALPHPPAFGDSAYPLRGTGVSGSMASVRPNSNQSPVPAPVEPPEIAAFRAEIQERAARESDTLYEVLGVAKDVAPQDIQPAFLALAKKWHPDRLPTELANMRELASRVFSRMTEANQVLSDPLQRREYDSKLRRAGREAEEQEHVQRVLRAATALQKADVFMKRNNLAAAEVEARQALADDPDQSDCIALVAWLDAQKPDANLDECIKALDRAIMIQPNNVRAHWYRGQLYKRAGRIHRAMRDFRSVVERDPRHTDALRELRLYQMRRGDRSTSIPPSGDTGRPSPPPGGPEKKPSPPPGSGGFISKLFKR